MSPSVKKFITLGVTGLVSALVASGILPESVTALLAPHVDALVLGVLGLILPEIGKATPAVEVKTVSEDEQTNPQIVLSVKNRSKRT
jgi:multisubunit Na+/H+ antiporter MnhE subunit